LVASRFRRPDNDDSVPISQAETESEDNPEATAQEDESLPTAYISSGAKARFRPLPILLLVVIIIGLTLWSAFKPDRTIGELGFGSGQRGLIASAVFMLVLILASMVRRQADVQIAEELEAERHNARSMAWGEFAHFIPALTVGVGLLWYLRQSGRVAGDWNDLLGGADRFLIGASVAIAGMVFGAMLGWTVRILGTLAFGKEAFGSGDIFIMAAIGAVGGIWMVVFSFFLAALLTLVGVLATLFRKSSRAIPFGPWLALGTFVAMYLYDLLISVFGPYGPFFWWILSGESGGM
ncbi:MAG: A24 family peptidase, partial [Planctomycetota bacterium]|nr:A24 family peptidase [Planctomycetota bacterium]